MGLGVMKIFPGKNKFSRKNFIAAKFSRQNKKCRPLGLTQAAVTGFVVDATDIVMSDNDGIPSRRSEAAHRAQGTGPQENVRTRRVDHIETC
jgi:hypothetical protein